METKYKVLLSLGIVCLLLLGISSSVLNVNNKEEVVLEKVSFHESKLRTDLESEGVFIQFPIFKTPTGQLAYSDPINQQSVLLEGL